MQLVLLKSTEMTRTALPDKVGGQYYVKSKNAEGEPENLFSVSAVDDCWVCKSNKLVSFDESFGKDAKGRQNIKFRAGSSHGVDILNAGNVDTLKNPLIALHIRSGSDDYSKTGRLAYLFIEDDDERRSSFTVYEVPSEGKVITVGSAASCTIRFEDNLLFNAIEDEHAKIIYNPDDSISVQITSKHPERAAVYLNERIARRRVKNSDGTVRDMPVSARYGDEIYVFGLRILLGKGFIAVNNPGSAITVSLNKKRNEMFVPKEYEDDIDDVSEFYSSAPRWPRSISTKEYTIDSPPKKEEGDAVPWVVSFGPSISMALMSVLSICFTISETLSDGRPLTSCISSLLMPVLMIMSSFVWPVFNRRFSLAAKKRKYENAKVSYISQLEKMQKDVEDEIIFQQTILRNNNRSIEDCEKMIFDRSERTLWERSGRSADFLDVSLGYGNLPADIKISCPTLKMTDEPDELTEMMTEFAHKKYELKDVPITVPLRSARVVGFTGVRQKVIDAVKALLIELIALHNYDELKIMFIYSEKEAHIWDGVKWLPHVWNGDNSVRMLANDAASAKDLSSVISNIQDLHSDKNSTGSDVHYVIIAADKSLADKMQSIKEFVNDPDKYDNMTLIALYDEQRHLPKTCSIVCDYGIDEISVSDYSDNTGMKKIISEPIKYNGDIDCVFEEMANIRLDSVHSERLLPKNIEYFEMFEAGMPEHFDILARWKSNDAVSSLAAPVGVDSNNDRIMLDIHEKAHGPHGSIAGMTGYGKSEFTISYIASMAVNYSPEDVSFVLIDFKGGGMAEVFKDLPHVAGRITNLDGNEIRRAFLAIENELDKRQMMFKDLGEKKKISNIDIYKYQKIRKENKDLEPLPHLIIIVDEFAELRDQYKDFISQLTRIARIGRSLGVHLILSTQKPDGVIDEQTKSNMRFKICLKVQSKSDSNSMLGRADAASITNPGRFYLQVGYNEIFELGQAPFSGAQYYPMDEYKKESSKAIEFIDIQGRLVASAEPAKKTDSNDEPEKQIDVLIQYIKDLAEENSLICRKLWCDPLEGPKKVVRKTEEDYNIVPFVMNPQIGLYDDIYNQMHRILSVPLTQKGHAVIYGESGSGKLDFLNKLIYSLICDHSPEEVQIYAIDCDAGSLFAFEAAPHIRAVVAADESDSIGKILNDIQKQIEHRKNLFKRYGGDYQTYISKSGETLPNIVLVIHDYQAFTETIGDGNDRIIKLAREGKKYGIFVVVSNTNAQSVSYKFRSMFANVYTLRQSNETDYADIIGKTGGMVPADYNGRGLFKNNNIVYEFQTDIIFDDSDNPFDAIMEFCSQFGKTDDFMEHISETAESEVAENSHEEFASVSDSVSVEENTEVSLDTDVSEDEKQVEGPSFDVNSIEISADRFPVGVDTKNGDMIFMNILENPITFISYKDRNDLAYPVLNMLKEIPGIYACFDSRSTSPLRTLDCRICDKVKIEEKIDELYQLILSRANECSKMQKDGLQTPEYENCIVVINGLADVMEQLDTQYSRKLSALMALKKECLRLNFVITNGSNKYSELIGYCTPALPFSGGIVLSKEYSSFSVFDSKIPGQELFDGFAFIIDKQREVTHAKIIG